MPCFCTINQTINIVFFSSDRLCYNCKKPGHLSKDCTVEDGENSKMLCFKCNEYGHMARSCKIPDNPRYVKYIVMLGFILV